MHSVGATWGATLHRPGATLTSMQPWVSDQVRQLRAAATAAGVPLRPIADLDSVCATAAAAGAVLWCAAAGEKTLSVTRRWEYSYPGLAAWGARVMLTAAGVSAASPIIADGVPPPTAEAVLAAAEKVDGLLSDRRVEVWLRVAADTAVAEGVPAWVRQVVLSLAR